MQATTASRTPAELHQAWQALLATHPKTRIRDAAAQLGTSEAELLATQVGDSVTRLAATDWTTLLEELPKLGRIMALTRNNAAVIEKNGEVNPPKFFRHGDGPAIGQVVGPDIDLRLFMGAWTHAFEVVTQPHNTPMRSLQFFDAQGHAIFKVYLKDQAKLPEWEALVAQFRAAEQTQTLATLPAPAPKAVLPDSEIDAPAFLEDWGNMTDTHQFFGLVRKYDLDRQQALRLAQGRFAWPQPTSRFQETLEHAAATGLSIMVFVGNHGCLEIHTGPIKKVAAMGSWYNILDPGFNLHVDMNLVATAWVVEKPTSDGLVSSLELFGHDNELILTLFGERKPGKPELPAWRQWIEQIKGA
jgi:putative hemin transport protein